MKFPKIYNALVALGIILTVFFSIVNLTIGLIFLFCFGFTLLVLRQYIYLYRAYNWGINKDWSHFLVEEIEIHVAEDPENDQKRNKTDSKSETCILKGKIYKSKKNENYRRPFVIMSHGLGEYMETLDPWAMSIALHGYNVLLYNLRGHGKKINRSQGDSHNLVKNFYDVSAIVELIKKREDAAADRIAFIGLSLGSIIALTTAYDNKEIKTIIALNSIHEFLEIVNQDYSIFDHQWVRRTIVKLIGDYDINENQNKLMSPKYHLKKDVENHKRLYMLTCKDDFLPFEDFIKNVELSGIDETNYFVLEKGGHYHYGQKQLVLIKMIEWLDSSL
ncbi:MAG: alpha/beta fold hydrolase [Candidatus Lokiarchaeota archaeon]|nr:alpha/beta fold hydrolase [Candidatus Lokiarchaeota archaeon]